MKSISLKDLARKSTNWLVKTTSENIGTGHFKKRFEHFQPTDLKTTYLFIARDMKGQCPASEGGAEGILRGAHYRRLFAVFYPKQTIVFENIELNYYLSENVSLMAKKFGKKNTPSSNKYLIECAWEVCNQVGGIYTVIRSKAQAMVNNHSGHYCMIGPYLNKNIMAELEPLEDAADVFGIATANLRKKGYDVVYAEWLITGKPRVVAFAHLVFLFIEELNQLLENDRPLIAHFHEWMAGLPILDIKKDNLPIKTIFPTHATQLGRHLAINSPLFYAHLPFFKWHDEAVKFGVAIEAAIEYGCAQSCTVMSTVSDVTANECRH